MKLLCATRNRGKMRELAELLADVAELEIVCLADLPLASEIEESGSTFAENAQIKALEGMRASGLPTLADDSGLEVDALGGAPGVHSARYAGPDASDAARNQKLLAALQSVPPAERRARFRCAVAFIDPETPSQVLLTEGSCEGVILDAPRGARGFGYDPLFFVEEIGKTFGEASAEEKNPLSHRGRAMRQMVSLLRPRLGAR